MLAKDIKRLIQSKYTEAYDNKALSFSDGDTSIQCNSENGMMYWIRYVPTLLTKPERGDTPANSDPLGEHEPELLVLQNMDIIEREYKLVLNKFPIMPNHSLLITNAYRHQNGMLTPSDLIKCYTLLEQVDTSTERHFIIFNCGPESGSSQNHKHLQLLQFVDGFIPFQDKLCNDVEPFLPSAKLAPLQDRFVSFAHFVVPLPDAPTEDYLMTCYVSLFQHMLTFANNNNNNKNEPPVSYNFILTRDWLCLVPRSSIRARSLPVGFNSLGYIGLVIIKEEGTLLKVKENPDIIDTLLLECGFPNAAKLKRQTHYNNVK